jgi:hypothetical protein
MERLKDCFRHAMVREGIERINSTVEQEMHGYSLYFTQNDDHLAKMHIAIYSRLRAKELIDYTTIPRCR